MGFFSILSNLFSTPQPSFEEQFETFKNLGFILNKGVDISDINHWKGGLKEFETLPYHLIYQTLGSTLERKPFTPLTNKCWNFDTEAIEDHGAYIDIMKNISRITNGELIFENITDFIEIEEETAWVSFTCNGDNYKWDLEVDNDWVDGELFVKVQDLTYKYKTKGKFTFFNTGGQDFVLGYETPEDLDIIRKTTGLEIVWLSSKGQIN